MNGNTTAIMASILDNTDAVWFDPAFNSELDIFIRHRQDLLGITPLLIEANLRVAYDRDIVGLLTSLRFPLKHHRSIMLVNGFNSNSDYLVDMDTIQIPNFSELEQFATIWQTKIN